ncbi:MAG: FecR family protein [Bacteroidales bacterium]|nr:FecR family protein [Bacteroidales bacterium]
MKNIKDICIRYFGGTSTPEDEKAIFAFVSESSGNKALFDEWELEWKRNIPESRQVFGYNKLKGEIARRKKGRMGRIAVSVLAASFALIVSVGAMTFLFRDSYVPETCLVRTGYNEKTKVVLPDDTVVWLNSGSSLSYSEDFVNTTREVMLEGEAYFDVVAVAGSPFIVHVSGIDIKVKGTRFNVTAYGKEAEISASLIEGAIVFTSDKVSVEMIPGEQLVYNLYTEDMTKMKIDTRPVISWINGKLDYTSISLPRLLERLSSLYGFEFRYTPMKYKNREFRIKLNDSEPIEDVLNAISVILPIEYVIEGNVITVTES